MSKAIILSIIARLDDGLLPGTAAPKADYRPTLELRAWACAPATFKTVVAGDRRLIVAKQLVSVKAATDEQLLSLVATYDRDFIVASMADFNTKFNGLVASNGIASTALGAVTDKVTGDGIAWNMAGNAIYWKAAPAGFAHAFSVEPVKTLMAEFKLEPGILDGIDPVNLQLLADQTGSSLRALRSMNLSRDPKVLADLALRVINIVSVFKLVGEKQVTMTELGAAVEGLRLNAVKYKDYTIEETADGNFIIKNAKGSTVEGPPLVNVETAKKYVDLDIRDNRPKVKAAAITKEFDAKGEQATPPSDKDHMDQLLKDAKRPAVIIDVEPEKDPLKVKQTLYTAKEVSVADLQKNAGKYALAQWATTMDDAKKKAKWLELRRADYQPLPDHWVPPAPEAAGEGVQEVKDEINDGKRMVVKEIKKPSSPQAMDSADKVPDTAEQVQKLRQGQVMAAGPTTVSFVKKDNTQGPDDDEVEATVKPASEEIGKVLETAGYKKVGEGVYAIYKVDQWAAMDAFKKALAHSGAGAVVEEAEHTLVLESGAPVAAAAKPEPKGDGRPKPDTTGSCYRCGEKKPLYTVQFEFNHDRPNENICWDCMSPRLRNMFTENKTAYDMEAAARIKAERTEEQQAFEDGLMDGGELDSEDVDGADVRIYDNGGETWDRYTILVEDPETGERSWLGSSENPFHPQGFGQHLGDQVQEGTHLGKKIKFSELPEQVQKWVHEEAQAYGKTYPVDGSIKAAWELVDEKNGKKLWIDRTQTKVEGEDEVSALTVTEGDAQPGQPQGWVSYDELKTGSGTAVAWDCVMGRLMAAPKDPKKKVPTKKKPAEKKKAVPKKKEATAKEPTVGDAVGETPKTEGDDDGAMPAKAAEPVAKTSEEPAPAAEGEGDFETKARAELAKALGCEPDDLKDGEVYYPIDTVNAVGFKQGNKEYVVFADEDDMEKAAKESVRNDFGPNGEGPDLFNQDFVMGHVDREALKAYMTQVFDEWAENDVDDLSSKDKEEWLEKQGLMPDNYLDDDAFDVDTFFETHREQWVQEQVADRLGNDGGESYWRDNLGDEEFTKIVKENNFIDVESLVEEAVSSDGASHFLNSYDGGYDNLPGGMVYMRTN